MLNIHFHCVIVHLTTKTHIASGGQKMLHHHGPINIHLILFNAILFTL